MATIKELTEKTRKIQSSLKTVKSDTLKKTLKEKLKTIEHEIAVLRKKSTTPAQKSELRKLTELVKKTKTLSGLYKGAHVDLKKDAKRQAKRPGWRVSKEGNRYYEARANRSDIRQSGRYPRLAHGGELHKTEAYGTGGTMHEADNQQYCMNIIYEIQHHVDEIISALEADTNVPAWMVGRLERANTDLSDVTHSLLGDEEEMDNEGIEDEVESSDEFENND